jgi:hypothetical protein
LTAQRAGALAFAVLAATEHHAFASEVEACLSAAELGERSKKEGHLVAAKSHLTSCAREACPSAVRDVCRRYLDDVTSAIPTLTISARDRANRELRDATFSIDSVDVTPGPDGTVDVDPGARLVRVTRGGVSKERLVEVSAGHKRTPVVVVLEAVVAAEPKRDRPVVTPPDSSRSRWPAYVIGGAGVLALGGSVFFGVRWASAIGCGPRCDSDEVDTIHTNALTADILLGVAVVGIATGTWLWLSGRSTPSATGASLDR